MNINKNILVTGGLGFIGSHTCVELLQNNPNHTIVVIDNLSNSKENVKNKIEEIVSNKSHIIFYNIDLLENYKMEQLFKKYNFDLIIHFAGLKAVSESIKNPLLYYKINVQGSLNLFKLADSYNVNNIIFSSSATVYGTNIYPVNEQSTVGQNITNPYGQSKYMIENILYDMTIANKKLSVVNLRYFNPVGAHPSGLIGEDPNDIPNNLFPHILKQKMIVFGNDYSTPDGTCIRDFIHVVDLAKGHLAAMKKMDNHGFYCYNLGSGEGTSVLEFIKTFEKVNNVKVDYTFGNRRNGDLVTVYADVNKAKKELGWETKKTIIDVCKDGYKFYKLNN